MDYIHNSTSESISAQLKADVLPIFSSLPSIYNFHSRCVKSFPFLKPAGIGVFFLKKCVAVHTGLHTISCVAELAHTIVFCNPPFAFVEKTKREYHNCLVRVGQGTQYVNNFINVREISYHVLRGGVEVCQE